MYIPQTSVIARAFTPVAIRNPCRRRRRGALHRKKTDSHVAYGSSE